jgi:hypothetical protein
MRRLSIRLPDPAYATLAERALASGEPLASTASGLLRAVLEDPEAKPATRLRSERPAPRTRPPSTTSGPPWLPSEQDPNWAEHTWSAILALYQRYPRALAKLEHDWYEHPERSETLAALVTWRASIDAAAEDPREELAFQNALQQLSRTVDQTPGLGRPFKTDTAMPVSWGAGKVV